jgi:hypothetical protein
MTYRTTLLAAIGALSLSIALTPWTSANDAKRPGGGLGEPGQLLETSIDSGRTQDGAFVLDGQDARQQLVVTGRYASEQLRDLTSAVSYEAAPAGIVRVEKSGLVIPMSDGTATITATVAGGPASTIRANVVHFANDPPVNFPNQIVPVFTKLGCNSGGCHGKASGQNGFRLSLLGFEPTEDYEHLVKEGRGRRLFPASPDKSLLLLKPIGEMPHGGGTRLEVDSHSYRLMRRWILQGMPYGSASDPTVARIEVLDRKSVV